MRNFKKKIMGIILGCMIGVFCYMPVFAAELSVSPYALERSCQNCGTGSVRTYTSREYEHDEKFACSHGVSNGYDVYSVYEVTERSSCNNCSYSSERTWHEHVKKYRPHNWISR